MKFRSRFYCMIDEKTKIRRTRDNRETATGGDPPYPPAFHWTCCFYVRVVCVTSVPQALLVPGHRGRLTRGARGSRGLVPHQRENLRFCVFATRQTPYPSFLHPPYHRLH